MEEGSGWWDRRGRLHAAAGVLRIEAEELTGQPYGDGPGAELAEIRGSVMRVRRVITSPPVSNPAPAFEGEEAVRGAAGEALRAAEVGDEEGVARSAGRVVAALGGAPSDGRGAELLVEGGMAVAGWLRRWGYRDLAWSVLQRARVRAGPRSVLVAEEMRVLLDGGWPGRALERAGCQGVAVDAVTGPVAAVALAVLGRASEADEVLAAAAVAAGSVRELAVVDVARATAALEASRPVAALEHLARLPGVESCGAGLWWEALVVRALAEARSGDTPAAAGSLATAGRESPLRTLGDPWARELLSALAPRALGDDGMVLRNLAAWAGVGPQPDLAEDHHTP
ncbi:hypothetical protein [Streptomyces amakusaensis]|uniref:Uncharacterized protein n=1 Tax=Streptomyces amakusaensis TaxID=67271 RepID=A0ABW0AQB3_9ACTN